MARRKRSRKSAKRKKSTKPAKRKKSTKPTRRKGSKRLTASTDRITRARPTSAFLTARAETRAAAGATAAGGITLERLKEAIKRAIDVDTSLMKITGDSFIESTLSAHVETLAQELKVLGVMIAADLFPSPQSVEDALGADFVTSLAASIDELDRLTVSDANFSALLAAGVRLSGAVERLRGAA